jgi:hypothetical protein
MHVALTCQSPAPCDKLSIIEQPVGLALARNAMVIAAIDTARKSPFFIGGPIDIAVLTRLSFSAVPAIATIYYTNIVSDTRRAKAAAGRVTQ